MNDQYCYQTSKKIRQIFGYKRRNGQYIGSFAPYGYIKAPKDKHHRKLYSAFYPRGSIEESRTGEEACIFKQIYEDDISGPISHDRFLKLSAEYEAENQFPFCHATETARRIEN